MFLAELLAFGLRSADADAMFGTVMLCVHGLLSLRPLRQGMLAAAHAAMHGVVDAGCINGVVLPADWRAGFMLMVHMFAGLAGHGGRSAARQLRSEAAVAFHAPERPSPGP